MYGFGRNEVEINSRIEHEIWLCSERLSGMESDCTILYIISQRVFQIAGFRAQISRDPALFF